MLTAFAEGADGIFIAESEQKSSPYPHSAAEIEANMEAVREILEENGVEAERLRYAQFVTVMLNGFVNHIDSLSDFCLKSGPIPSGTRKELIKDINVKLFTDSGKEPIQI
jgi:coenzyme F420-reducing hydrogenase delta subunit